MTNQFHLALAADFEPCANYIFCERKKKINAAIGRLRFSNKCYLNCLLGSPLGFTWMWITEDRWFLWTYNKI